MSYQAIVCAITQVMPIEGADRIQTALVAGHQVVVGKSQKVGDLGCFFPSDGALSGEMCFHNNLFRLGKGENKDPKASGFICEKRRVKTIRLKKTLSDGFWCPVESLAWTGETSFKEGDMFTYLNGKLVCEKYYSKATQQLINSQKQKQAKVQNVPRINTSQLLEHYDTPQLKYLIGNFQTGAVIWITEKLHGTSGRTGNVFCKVAPTKFQYWWNRFASFVGLPLSFNDSYIVVSGTRHVNLNPSPDSPEDRGYYAGSTFRSQIHEWLKAKGLQKGETVFYEIVGFDDKGTSIMPSHTCDPKEHKEFYSKYPEARHQYKYGCDVGSESGLGGKFQIYVYRISFQDQDLNTHDLTWAQTVKRCDELGLKTVPVLAGPLVLNETFQKEDLLKLANKLSDGPSILDTSHTREGVVVIAESSSVQRGFKQKGWLFRSLECLIKEDEKYIDPEEIA